MQTSGVNVNSHARTASGPCQTPSYLLGFRDVPLPSTGPLPVGEAGHRNGDLRRGSCSQEAAPGGGG